jgi:hypothetical protein
MDIDDDAKKVIWSLQNNKRTEEERNVFKPTGKKPMNKNLVYIGSAFGITFLLSYVMTQFTTESVNFCFLVDSYCFNSTENPFAFVFYVFMNLWIIILGIAIAYLIGKKLGNRFKV